MDRDFIPGVVPCTKWSHLPKPRLRLPGHNSKRVTEKKNVKLISALFGTTPNYFGTTPKRTLFGTTPNLDWNYANFVTLELELRQLGKSLSFLFFSLQVLIGF